jgi:hypothetical protein
VAALVVHPAGPDDLPAVHELLDAAAAWLVGRGIAQWPSPQHDGADRWRCSRFELAVG